MRKSIPNIQKTLASHHTDTEQTTGFTPLVDMSARLASYIFKIIRLPAHLVDPDTNGIIQRLTRKEVPAVG